MIRHALTQLDQQYQDAGEIPNIQGPGDAQVGRRANLA